MAAGQQDDLHDRVHRIQEEDDSWVQRPAQELREESPELREEVAEDAKIRVGRKPHEPTRQEREEHEVDHEPYRAWCQACVAGRGRAQYHITADHSDDAVPVLGVDYGYLSKRSATDDDNNDDKDESGQPCSPILCGRCSKDRWIEGCVVPSKGVEHPYNVQALTNMLKNAGCRRMLVRSDQEPAILALIRQAGTAARLECGIEAVPDPARLGDKDANGLAEGAVKEVKGKTRTLKYALERLLNLEIGPNHWCLPFLVMYACATINRGRRGVDGRTPYELSYGRAYHG